MKKRFEGKALFSLIIISLLILPAVSHAEKQKIKVIVEDASIRLKPNMESEIIESPSLGSVFEVEKKVGEWYEIKFSSRVGVQITGYIHEMFVEIEKEIPKPKKKFTKRPPKPVFEPEPREAVLPKRVFANIKAGGLFALIQAGYDYSFSFPLWSETATVTDSVDNDNAFGFDAGFGIFVLKNIEITGSVNFFSKGLTGYYGYSLPNILIFNDIAVSEAEAYPALKETVFSFGINIHPVTSGIVKPYFGGGVSYVSAKMDLLDDMQYTETFYVDSTHTIEITDVQFVETSISKFGFNATAGINFMMTNNVSIYAEGKYIIAKKEVPHPLCSQLDEEETIDINLGGISLILGIKLFF